MTWIQVIRLLPEILMLLESLSKTRELRAPEEGPLTTKEMRRKLQELDEAFRTNDSEKLNKAFNSI